MPSQTGSYRPQTLRQAKRAYQKSRSSTRLSDIERRRLQREAELQERASRIRLQEERTRENRRKKLEKLEREREVRKRMGIPEPEKAYIGPSQLRLGTFIKAGTKVDDMEGKENLKPLGENDEEKLSSQNPSRFLSVRTPPEIEPVADQQRQEHLLTPESYLKSPLTLSSRPQPKNLPISSSRLNSFGKEVSQIHTPPSAQLTRILLNKSMPPPPRPHQLPKPDHVKPRATLQDDWDFLLDSNTQILREISASASQACNASTKSDRLETETLSDSETFLAGISTQDWEGSDTEPSSQPNNEPDHCSDFGDDIAAEDLIGVANTVEYKKLEPKMTEKSQSKQHTVRFQRPMWPTRPLSNHELQVIIWVLLDEYHWMLSKGDVKTLISGNRLPGEYAIISPMWVANIAKHIVELSRQNRMPTSHVDFLCFMQEMDGKEVLGTKHRAYRKPLGKRNVVKVKTHDEHGSQIFVNKPKPRSQVPRLETNRANQCDTGEFNDFLISTQDLRELGV
ncbi:MAG: hypothetical protein LQ342_008175 [Letrouitia transgressa]|nr:MAG: hypothetical protein LQ342_008175 [Letrouitia transgressa]